MLKVRTLFSGIGSPESALKNIGIDYELVDFCEVDKYAIKSYCAVHGVSEDKNLGDVSKVWGRDLPYADLLVWGFPCTDISVAGKRGGIIEGETKSGLYYEGFRVLKETKPKYSIIENVKNLAGKKFKTEFEQMLKDIEGLGYNNYWKILNAKDYGIPQNRERVFIVSIRADIDNGKFAFPIGFDNGLRLKDYLENEVDEKYYINKETTEAFLNKLDPKKLENHNKLENKCIQLGMLDIKGNEQIRRVYAEDGLCPTVNTMQGGNRQPKVLIEPRIVAQRGRYVGGKIEQQFELRKDNLTNTLTTVQKDNLVLENKCIQLGSLERAGYHEFSNRIYSPKGAARTIMGSGGNLNDKAGQYLINYRIRRLTPKECWRLMGFSDIEFNKAQAAGVSNSQLYKQAGNSIYTGNLAGIFINLLKGENNMFKKK